MNRVLACLFVWVFFIPGLRIAVHAGGYAVSSLATPDILKSAEIPLPSAPFPEFADESEKAFADMYFPLRPGSLLVYEHTGSEFEGVETVSIETAGAVSQAGEILIRVQSELSGRKNEGYFTVTKKPWGVFSSGAIISGNRLEFPIPAAKGKKWSENSSLHRITSLESSVEVPAGRFAGCMKVETAIGGGDGGKAARFYCPGAGLVYEEYSGEDKQDTIKLVSFR